MTTRPATPKLDRSRKVAITGIMSALALAGNYVLAGIPNVELGTMIFFLTAYTFESAMAVSCVLIVAVVFGTVNPWGGAVPLILLAQIVAWLFTVAVGTLMGMQNRTRNGRTFRPLQFALAGLITTGVFDIITNIAFAWTSGITFLAAFTTGLPFMLVHMASNAALFGAGIEVLDLAIRLHVLPVFPCAGVDESNENEEEKSRLDDSDMR